jgi:hypothetical protein
MGVVMGARVLLVGSMEVGGCSRGPESIQFTISERDEKWSSPVASWIYISV